MAPNLCSLASYESIEDLILDMGISTKSGIKKHLTKKERSKRVIQFKDYCVPIGLLNLNKVNPRFKGYLPEVLLEDDNFLFLHKPRLVHNYPLSYHEMDNLLSFMRQESIVPFYQSLYSDYGLLNRLDFLTSGILVYAKSDEVKREVMKHHRSIFRQKFYLAVIEGKVPPKFEVCERLLPSQKSGMKIKVDLKGKEGSIKCECLEYSKQNNLSLLKVELFEGLRHQIRILLSHYGTPIKGDPLYGNSEGERMFLHHHQLEFNYQSLATQITDTNYSLFKRIFPSLE